LCNWFQPENNNIDVFLLMNGDIFNHPPTSKQYNWNGRSAYAIPPNPPTSTSTITGKPLPAQSHINTYNTAFNQPRNRQYALNKYYQPFDSNEVNNNFVPGTFRYEEEYSSYSQSLTINYLQDDASVYVWNSLFICFSRFWRRIWIYVFRLDYSNLWSSLCCECILKIIVKKLAGRIISLLWKIKRNG